MVAATLEHWVDTAGSGPESLLQHRFLTPPYGYVVGIALWPANLLFYSVAAALLLSGFLPATVAAAGSYLFLAGFVIVSVSSALVMGVTAWNTPSERLRQQAARLSSSLLLAVLLFGLYATWPTVPYSDELGLSTVVAHELSRIILLGPAIGFAFVGFPLVVLGYRLSFT